MKKTIYILFVACIMTGFSVQAGFTKSKKKFELIQKDFASLNESLKKYTDEIQKNKNFITQIQKDLESAMEAEKSLSENVELLSNTLSKKPIENKITQNQIQDIGAEKNLYTLLQNLTNSIKTYENSYGFIDENKKNINLLEKENELKEAELINIKTKAENLKKSFQKERNNANNNQNNTYELNNINRLNEKDLLNPENFEADGQLKGSDKQNDMLQIASLTVVFDAIEKEIKQYEDMILSASVLQKKIPQTLFFLQNEALQIYPYKDKSDAIDFFMRDLSLKKGKIESWESNQNTMWNSVQKRKQSAKSLFEKNYVCTFTTLDPKKIKTNPTPQEITRQNEKMSALFQLYAFDYLQEKDKISFANQYENFHIFLNGLVSNEREELSHTTIALFDFCDKLNRGEQCICDQNALNDINQNVDFIDTSQALNTALQYIEKMLTLALYTRVQEKNFSYEKLPVYFGYAVSTVHDAQAALAQYEKTGDAKLKKDYLRFVFQKSIELNFLLPMVPEKEGRDILNDRKERIYPASTANWYKECVGRQMVLRDGVWTLTDLDMSLAGQILKERTKFIQNMYNLSGLFQKEGINENLTAIVYNEKGQEFFSDATKQDDPKLIEQDDKKIIEAAQRIQKAYEKQEKRTTDEFNQIEDDMQYIQLHTPRTPLFRMIKNGDKN